ncbi:type 1 glutamine amidotransferase [Salicibibacter halophilus]|uniref:Type 1 glutamine amidotransferase n=1 Tax=Salicibibacter halophilus TaxID=2502791 RepID=A0A514LKD1_9BACI|nr:type 1 glutamine amidotransferase [Salicibibacter halophilus]QDI91721.1 type 1 glutamine amidotransferase [Salicibibacter halophilus]
MTVLIIQPMDMVPAGELLYRIQACGKEAKICRIDQNEPLPDSLEAFDSLVILGGTMSANEGNDYPFIEKTISTVQKFHAAKKPVLGICLGAQIIAQAFGAAVGKMGETEFGVTPLAKTEEGTMDPVFSRLPDQFSFMQFHEDSFALPTEAIRLATGKYCINQAYRIGSKTYGVQFHPEVNASIVDRWYVDKKETIENIQPSRSMTDIHKHLSPTKKWAHGIFDDWLALA